MENNKEQQNSTEQYCSNIESSIEEQSFSLEDLHPEEKKVESYKPIQSSSVEVQPDPTIIDGVKETIGDKYTNVSHPKIQTVAFCQNNLEKMPLMSHTHQHTNNNEQQKQPSFTVSENSSEVQNVKIFYLIFGIILLVILVAFPLYSSGENLFSNNSGTSEKISNDDDEKTNNETISTIPNSEDSELEESQNSQISESIEFDMTLSFDKGFVSNEQEIEQEMGFLPTNITGVVRCNLKQAEIISGVTKYASTYLYYENYKLKQAITVTEQIYPDPATYSEAKNATLVYKESADKANTLDVLILQDDSTYTVKNTMKYNLEFGSTTYIESIDTYLKFSSEYDTNIKTAIDNVINKSSNKQNIICSSINTNEAGL